MVWNISIDCIDFVWFMSGRLLYTHPCSAAICRAQYPFFVCRCLSQATVTTTTASNNWERNHFPVAILLVYLTKTRFCQIEERLYKWTVLLISSEKKANGPHFFRKWNHKTAQMFIEKCEPTLQLLPPTNSTISNIEATK